MNKLKLFLLLFLLLPWICFAQEIPKIQIIKKITDKNGIEWQSKDSSKNYANYTKAQFLTVLNTDGYYESLVKPNIATDKQLNETESDQVKTALWNDGLVDEQSKVLKEGRKLIFEKLKPTKNDYKHDFERGTVYFTPTNRNYSYHKVIIPDDTTIKENNFSQRKPDTDAIQGKNLTFIDCNLVNIKIDASWTLINCNIAKIQRVIKQQINLGNETKLEISQQTYNSKTKNFEEIGIDEETIDNGDLNNRLLYFQ
jgi:hypothetical protein